MKKIPFRLVFQDFIKEDHLRSLEMTYGQLGKQLGTWVADHPKLWVNPLSIQSILRATTGFFRILPNFIIIGAPKCGTTSLYNYIVKHPGVFPALWKEIYFFDRYFSREINWYKGNFHLKSYKFFYNSICRKQFVTGESTPTYFHHPLAPKRISKFLPHMKLIVLLRNPVDRAYSHYQMEKSLGYEELTFEEAISAENDRLHLESEKMIEDINYYSYKRQIFSYLTSGIYVKHLELWMKYFPKNQILILNTEDFERDPNDTYQTVLNFLDLSPFKSKFKKLNVGKYPKMNEETKKKLYEFFKPHNRRLSKLLNRDFGWE